MFNHRVIYIYIYIYIENGIPITIKCVNAHYRPKTILMHISVNIVFALEEEPRNFVFRRSMLIGHDILNILAEICELKF